MSLSSRNSQPSAKFSMGQIVATPAALSLLEEHGANPFDLLSRHSGGDWGDLGAEDRRLNDAALQDGSRILSSYRLGGDKLWIITEAADDHGRRAATTILCPDEY